MLPNLTRVLINNFIVFRTIIEKHNEEPYIESCGILFGKKNYRKNAILLEKIVSVQNITQSSTKFEISPETLLFNLDKWEKKYAFIGFIHSHLKGPNYPSSTDIQTMHFWPEKIWIIAVPPSMHTENWDFKAYVLNDNQIIRLAIETVNSQL